MSFRDKLARGTEKYSPPKYTNAPYRRMMKSTRCVRCKMCNFSTTSTEQYGRTLGSEVTNFPGSGAYIPLGSLSSRQFRYLKRRIASLARPGNPASRRCLQAQSKVKHADITCYSCPDFPQARGSLGCQQLHQIYLFVYVDLRIVLANLSLPQ